MLHDTKRIIVEQIKEAMQEWRRVKNDPEIGGEDRCQYYGQHISYIQGLYDKLDNVKMMMRDAGV